MPTTPTTTLPLREPITVNGVKTHLIGLRPWLDAAADEGYDDAQIRITIQDSIAEFQNESRLRIVPSQIVMEDSGVYDGTNLITDTTGLDLTDAPLTVERYDRLPFYPDSASQWFRLELPANPVREIQSLQFFLGPNMIYDVPKGWIVFDRAEGTLHLLPFFGHLQSVMSAVGASIVLGAGSPSYGTPQALAVNYVAGLPNDWTKQPRWAYLRPGIEKWAALAVLEKISEVFDPGLSGSGVSAFGLGQQANYTRFQTRKQELEQAKQKLIETVQPNANFLAMEVI